MKHIPAAERPTAKDASAIATIWPAHVVWRLTRSLPGRFECGSRLLWLIEPTARIGQQAHPPAISQSSAQPADLPMLEAGDLRPGQPARGYRPPADDALASLFDRRLRGPRCGNDKTREQHVTHKPRDDVVTVNPYENQHQQGEDPKEDSNRAALRVPYDAPIHLPQLES